MLPIFKKLKADADLGRESLGIVRGVARSARVDLQNGQLALDVYEALAGRRPVNSALARNSAIAAAAASLLLGSVSISWMLTPGPSAVLYAMVTGGACIVFGSMALLYWRLSTAHHMAQVSVAPESSPLLIEHQPAAEMPLVHDHERE